jgi:hypothetical protein
LNFSDSGNPADTAQRVRNNHLLSNTFERQKLGRLQRWLARLNHFTCQVDQPNARNYQHLGRMHDHDASDLGTGVQAYHSM